ncbi:MAG TPA: DNA-processing protein DprA [Thermoleophilaceae bacterium]|nr:DNA-processing protein DprA [Thermoleophilaceae bacterium]
MEACDQCLRRSFLIAHLAARIAGLLGLPKARRTPGLLALSNDELVRAATAAGGRARAHEFLDRFDPAAARDRLDAGGFIAVCRHGAAYPPSLHALDDPPAVLFGLGQVEALARVQKEPSVALVGTRHPSPYGTEVAHAFGRGLGAAGVPVVSGLALGIDASAHRGCLDAGGLAIAVLACGPDLAYPRRHRALHERVRERGVVVSELPPGTQPFRWSFPARNRIMVGLARMTLVVEAAQPSGSLISATFARELGRTVAVVPGRVTSSVAQGVNELLRDGALPVTSTEDVLEELFGVGVREVPPEALRPPRPRDPVLNAVLEAAELTGSVEQIARAAGLSTGEARAALGRLEFDGHLVRRDLDGWERAAR